MFRKFVSTDFNCLKFVFAATLKFLGRAFQHFPFTQYCGKLRNQVNQHILVVSQALSQGQLQSLVVRRQKVAEFIQCIDKEGSGLGKTSNFPEMKYAWLHKEFLSKCMRAVLPFTRIEQEIHCEY